MWRGGVGGRAGDVACARTAQIWTLSEGVARSDNAPVSVFRPSPAAKESHKAFAAGGARRLRVIRHPHVLSFVHAMDDGASPAPQLVALVTEPIVPLRTWLAGVHGRSWEDAASKCAWSDSAVAATAVEGCAYGLWCVATALEFLHTECGLVHGNVCVDTVFVTRGGDWRLGGVELIGDRGVWPSTALRDARAASALEAPVQPPEVESGDWKAVSAGAVHAVDSFLFGVLALQVRACRYTFLHADICISECAERCRCSWTPPSRQRRSCGAPPRAPRRCAECCPGHSAPRRGVRRLRWF